MFAQLFDNRKDKKPGAALEQWIAISAPSQDIVNGGRAAGAAYLEMVRAEVQDLLERFFRDVALVKYQLVSRGEVIRGGYYASPGLALQELLHEFSAEASRG